MTISTNSQYQALHLSTKLISGNKQRIQLDVNISVHPLLDYSDMYPDITTWLQRRSISLSSLYFEPHAVAS